MASPDPATCRTSHSEPRMCGWPQRRIAADSSDVSRPTSEMVWRNPSRTFWWAAAGPSAGKPAACGIGADFVCKTLGDGRSPDDYAEPAIRNASIVARIAGRVVVRSAERATIAGLCCAIAPTNLDGETSVPRSTTWKRTYDFQRGAHGASRDEQLGDVYFFALKATADLVHGRDHVIGDEPERLAIFR